MQTLTLNEQKENLLRFSRVHDAEIIWGVDACVRPYSFISARMHEDEIRAYLYKNGSMDERMELDLSGPAMKKIESVWIQNWIDHRWTQHPVIEYNESHHEEQRLVFKVKGIFSSHRNVTTVVEVRTDYNKLLDGQEARSQGGVYKIRLNKPR